MIAFGSQRAGGTDLATHLSNAEDNEYVEVADLRGSVAEDLHGAFAEWEAQAHAMTRAKKYLYSLSVNPDPAQGQLTREQYMDYITRAEERLGECGGVRPGGRTAGLGLGFAPLHSYRTTHGPDGSAADTMYPAPGQWFCQQARKTESVAEGSIAVVAWRYTTGCWVVCQWSTHPVTSCHCAKP